MLRPLHQHLSSLPAQRGKRYRARLVSQVIEVGAGFLFSADHTPDAALVLAYRAAIPNGDLAQEPQKESGEVIRVSVVIPAGSSTDPLLQRLQALPERQGKQDRSRLVSQVVQSGVGVLYRGAIASLGAPADIKPSDSLVVIPPSAPAEQKHLLPEMTDFMDNLSMEGLK